MSDTAVVEERRRSGKRTGRRRAVAWLVLAAVVVGWWAFLRPAVLGGPVTFVVVHGSSMEPGLHTGDLALVYRQDDYRAGDVVAFRHREEDGGLGSHVIHRITGGDGEEGFVVRGDNNDWDDPWRPTEDEVVGEMLYSVDGAGRWFLWITQPLHLAALLASVAVGLVLSGPRKARS